MLVSSLPNALVATQVKSAESVRSSLLTLRSERTPVGRISSRIVYLFGYGTPNYPDNSSYDSKNKKDLCIVW